VPPAFEYSSAGTEARCSITGGYVVRDPSLAALAGRYLYGDFCTGELRTADLAAGTERALNVVVSPDPNVADPASRRLSPLSLARAQPGDAVNMGIGTSLFLIAVGAILYFAVNADISGLEISTVGIILMVVGVVGLVISLIFLSSARRDPGRTVVRDRDVY
jgi:hypothetical protein